jgi:ribosome maturation factor RimP
MHPRRFKILFNFLKLFLHFQKKKITFARIFVKTWRRGTEIPLILYVKGMISREIVKDLVLSAISGTAIFVVDVKVDSAGRIFVEVDKPEGITIEECARISRAVESGLNRETEDFELEVSSPGLTAPFKVMEQYRRNCGRQVDVVKCDGQKISGLLQHADDDGIVLEVQTKIREAGQKRPKTVMQTVVLKFSDIKATKVAITF